MFTKTETKQNDPAVSAVTQGWARLNDEQRRTVAFAMMSTSTIELEDDPVQSGDNWKDLAKQLGAIEWAWDKWLPKGLLTILAGESGAGKSALALRICGVFLRGDPWPDGTPYTGEQGSVLWCEAEAVQAVGAGGAVPLPAVQNGPARPRSLPAV